MRLKPHRDHKAYWAFLGHRLSGLALALFLPVHFWVLALALDAARLDAVLVWAEQPLVKAAEWGLVVLLALHLCFGARLLAIELTDWRAADPGHASWIIPSAAAALAVGALFLIAGLA